MEDRSIKISNETWGEIVAETRRKIDNLQTLARQHDKGDKFRCDLRALENGDQVLLSEHCAYETKFRAVTRNPAGELCPAKPRISKNIGLVGFETKPAPKAWAKLAEKPAAEIVKALRLTDFLLILRAETTGSTVTRIGGQ